MRKPIPGKYGFALLTACVFMLTLCVFAASPRPAAAVTPVRIVGTIVPMQQAEGPGGQVVQPDDYVLQYKGHQWALKIDRVHDLFVSPASAEGLDGWSLLGRMGRQRIVLVGPAKGAVETLERPDILCKGVVIQGTLYLSIGRLALATVEPAPAQNLPAKCS